MYKIVKTNELDLNHDLIELFLEEKQSDLYLLTDDGHTVNEFKMRDFNELLNELPKILNHTPSVQLIDEELQIQFKDYTMLEAAKTELVTAIQNINMTALKGLT